MSEDTSGLDRADFQMFLGFLFKHCEPTLDGFERIVAAAAAMKNSDVELFFDYPFYWWVKKVHRSSFYEDSEIMTGRLWAAVGKWRDADLCFEALKAATCLVSEQLDDTEYVRRARRLTANWENRSNAQHVIDAFQKLTDEIEEQQYEEDDESGGESPPTD
jgi:hypothetical protein